MKKPMLLALSAILILTGCTAPPLAADRPAETAAIPAASQAYVQAASFRGSLASQPIEPLDSGFVSGINSFGFSAASRLYSDSSNLALSPVSLELALCMARNGASGGTKDEMSHVLGLSDLTDDEITSACKSLMWRANTGGMEAANALWLLDDYQYNSDYIKTCTVEYMADIEPLTLPGAKDAVNAWAKEKTHGRIDQILSEEPDTMTRMIITNALYYLGDWELPFEANDTRDREFATPAGAVTAPFMSSEWSVPYYANDQFSMITLKFKAKDDEGHYAMALMLPAEGSSADTLIQSINGETFKAALDGAQEQQVSIRLPKFEFSFFAPLADTLKSMGMEAAFSPDEADFSGMTDADQLYISSVLHNCYVRVDELGAEAAAVTAVIMNAKGASPDQYASFHVDRPFLFAIYSEEDGAIAFLGAVNNPLNR